MDVLWQIGGLIVVMAIGLYVIPELMVWAFREARRGDGCRYCTDPRASCARCPRWR